MLRQVFHHQQTEYCQRAPWRFRQALLFIREVTGEGRIVPTRVFMIKEDRLEGIPEPSYQQGGAVDLLNCSGCSGKIVRVAGGNLSG